MGMFGAKTKVEDVVKWRRANRVGDIARVLSDRDPDVRLAAATALEQVDTSGVKQAALDAAAAALLDRLGAEPDPRVVVSIVRAIGNLGTYARKDADGTSYHLRPEAVSALVATMNRTGDPATRNAAGRSIERILLVKNSTERVKGCLVVFPLLARAEGLSRETAAELLGILASVYIWAFKAQGLETTYEWEASPLGRAFVEYGPDAGRALMQVGTRLEDATAVSFGARIVEGRPHAVDHAEHGPGGVGDEEHDYQYVDVGSGGYWICTTCGARREDGASSAPG